MRLKALIVWESNLLWFCGTSPRGRQWAVTSWTTCWRNPVLCTRTTVRGTFTSSISSWMEQITTCLMNWTLRETHRNTSIWSRFVFCWVFLIVLYYFHLSGSGDSEFRISEGWSIGHCELKAIGQINLKKANFSNCLHVGSNVQLFCSGELPQDQLCQRQE